MKFKAKCYVWRKLILNIIHHFFQPTFLHLAPPVVSFLANSEKVKPEHLESTQEILSDMHVLNSLKKQGVFSPVSAGEKVELVKDEDLMVF